MISYATESVFDTLELEALERATDVVRRLPDRGLTGQKTRCHEVARVVAMVQREEAGGLGCLVLDGTYCGISHSWLVLRNPDAGNVYDRSLLDPYVIGSLPQVQLLKGTWPLVLRGKLYVDGKTRTDIETLWVERWAKEVLEQRREQGLGPGGGR